MKRVLTRNWDLVLISGILGIIFGTATLFMPGITLIVLVALFGTYALISGVMNVVVAIKDRKGNDDWWLLLLYGLVSIAAGMLTFVYPGITAEVLFYVIVAWAIASGVVEIILAIQLRREIDNEWLLALSGILSIALGIVLVSQPAAGLLAVLWMIGGYAIVSGTMLIVLSFRLRKFENAVENLAQKIEYRHAHEQ